MSVVQGNLVQRGPVHLRADRRRRAMVVMVLVTTIVPPMHRVADVRGAASASVRRANRPRQLYPHK